MPQASLGGAFAPLQPVDRARSEVNGCHRHTLNGTMGRFDEIQSTRQ
ncbi:uncharacterized protein METZ01_LOCUS131610 [marine metagenome]|uniref:Uncharacterized protein n=1 Tax=marine metagenome TaxID=408172 RepID=A0A381YP01_9ZZZZ